METTTSTSYCKNLLRELRAKGITLTLKNGSIDLSPEEKMISPEVREIIDQNMDFFVEHLMDRQSRALIQEEDELAEMDDMQQVYWVGENSALDLSVVSNYYFELDFETLDVSKIDSAWNAILTRHEALRSIITPSGKVKKLQSLPIYSVKNRDISRLRESNQRAELESVRSSMINDELPTGKWPQFLLSVTKIASNKIRLHFRYNLWLLDGFSIKILLSELVKLCDGETLSRERLTLTPRGYVDAKRSAHRGTLYERDREYWLSRAETFFTDSILPLRAKPNQVNAPKFIHLSERLSKGELESLKELSKASRVSVFILLFAAYVKVLSRWSKQDKFCITVLYSNRPPLHSEALEIVGNFGSTLIVEVEWSNSMSFIDNAKIIQKGFWRDIGHGSFSGVDVVREVNMRRRDYSGITFPIAFTSATMGIDYSDSESKVTMQRYRHVFGRMEVSQVFLDCQIMDDCEEGLIINWDYVDQMFPENLLANMFGSFTWSIRQIALNRDYADRLEDQPLPQLDLDVISSINSPFSAPSIEWLHTLFFRSVERHPDLPALIDQSGRLSYAEANGIVLAVVISVSKSSLGVTGELVAVFMEKGWEQAVGALAILALGGAYVPIDPTLPEQRIKVLLEESGVSAIFTQSKLIAKLNAILGDSRTNTMIEDITSYYGYRKSLYVKSEIEKILPQLPDNNGLAYVIFTSGTTGKPKGVMIDHRGAVNTILDINERCNIVPSDSVLAVSSLSFDLSVYDLFGVLAAGGAVVFPSPLQDKDVRHWIETIRRHNITIWNSVPALAQLLMEHDVGGPPALKDLRLFMLSGDVIPTNLPSKIWSGCPSAEILSLGGATEASIWSVVYPITEDMSFHKSIPYGRAMKNQSLYVLDKNLRFSPLWVEGDIYIGGVGVAKGYWKDETRTTASFTEDLKLGTVLYRTGDIGRVCPSGHIEFIGREDSQVKIQGYRIECDEISRAIEDSNCVHRALVTAIGDNVSGRQLVAYLVPRDGMAIDSDSVRALLRGTLPPYMVPTYFVMLDTIPLTRNGKVDSKSLPLPVRATKAKDSRIRTESEIEARLVEIYERILAVDGICPEEDVYSLGITSFIALMLVSELHKQFSIDISLSTLLERSSIAGVAHYIAEQRKANHMPPANNIVVSIREGGEETPLFCVHPVGGNVFCYSHLAKVLGSNQPLYGIQSPVLFAQSTISNLSIVDMASLYLEEVEAKQPFGPYRFLGWSMGGVVALEMARQVTNKGGEIELLILIDSFTYTSNLSDFDIDHVKAKHSRYIQLFVADIEGLYPEFSILSELQLLSSKSQDEQLEFVLEKAKDHGLFPPDFTKSQMAVLFRSFKINMEALENYRPSFYDGEVHLFYAKERLGAESSLDQWDKVCSFVTYFGLNKNHYSIVDTESYEFIADRIGLI